MAAPNPNASPIVDWVIDVDTHITEPPDLFSSRLPAKWRDQAPSIRMNDQGSEEWVVGNMKPITPVGHTATAGWKEPFPAAPARFDEVPQAAHDAHARLDYMDSLAIWAMALYPNVGGFGSQVFLGLEADGEAALLGVPLEDPHRLLQYRTHVACDDVSACARALLEA